MKKASAVLPLLVCAAAGLPILAQPPAPAGTDAAVSEPAKPGGYVEVVDQAYKIKPEDYLNLSVWGEPELKNVQLLVTPDGQINVPFLGSMQAEGLTVAELTEDIVSKFESEEILVNPRIQVAVLTIHRPKARVLGEVNRPGEFEYKDGDRILDAIAQAGSYRDNAWLENASLMRKGSNEALPIDLRKMLAGDLTQNFELQQGDTIYIPPEDYANKVYVLGYVMRPGIYSLKEDTSVLDAITLAGGPNERGAMKGTMVVRGDPKNPTRVPCDMTRLFDKGDLTQNIILRAGDVVMVPETNRPDWSKVSAVLSTIMNLTYLRRYGLF